MEENQKNNDDAFYMKINSELKRDFNIKCLQNNTSMSVVIKDFMKEYIER